MKEKEIVNCASYSDGRRVSDVAVEDISELLKVAGQFIWIGLYEPSGTTLRKVQEEFGLHDLAIEDALRAHQRPKLEEYGTSLFIVLRTAQLGPEHQLEFGETHLFVGPTYLISIRHGSARSYAEVRARAESTPHLLKKGPGFVLYAIMDFVVDQYFPIVDTLEEDLEMIETEIFDESHYGREISERIYHLKRDLLALKRAVSPLIDVCNRLMRYDLNIIPDDVRPYFRDVYDHVIRINESIDTLRELVTGALEANLTLISVAQAEVAKKLAGWAAIIAVPTMVAGIYGMNFKHMPELDWRYGYPVVIGGTIAVCALVYSRFRKSGWL